MSKTYIGIDPGVNGACTMITPVEDGNPSTEWIVRSWVMPTIGKEIDSHALVRILSSISTPEKVHCVVEDVHAIFGSAAGATFKFGYVCGLIEGILVSNHIPFTKVQPKTWQATMFQGIPLQTKKSTSGKTTQTDTKKMALMAVNRLFPKYKLTATDRSTKPHDGLVDATLIAEYCRRNF